jgi:Zinc finger, C2H2 type
MLANNSQQKHYTSKVILPVISYPVIISEQKINSAAPTVIGTIDQPQKCQMCQKDFPSMMAFQTHIKETHLDQKIYRNIIAVSTVNSPVTMIPAQVAQVQHHHYQIAANNTVKIEKDFQPIKSQTIIHTSDVLKQAFPTDYATVTNLNMTPVIQQIQLQQARDKDKSNIVQVIKQNPVDPVEYHIQQQEHAAMVVAQMNQKSGITSPFMNSTIKYELHAQPVQLVTEVYPQMITETVKSDDMNSQSSVSSPASSINMQTANTGPVLSNGETMEKQHKCLICDKFFTTVANLNIHLKTHAGDKPYSKHNT